MSALPKLKPRKKLQQVMRMKKNLQKFAKMTPGEEIILAKNFGYTKPAPSAGLMPKQIGNTDNNNTVFRQITGTIPRDGAAV